MEAYRQDQAIVKRLTDHDKSNPTWQQGLLWIDEKLGEALAVQSKVLEALEVLQQALPLAKNLAEPTQQASFRQRRNLLVFRLSKRSSLPQHSAC
jgi:hypothetical protein